MVAHFAFSNKTYLYMYIGILYISITIYTVYMYIVRGDYLSFEVQLFFAKKHNTVYIFNHAVSI